MVRFILVSFLVVIPSYIQSITRRQGGGSAGNLPLCPPPEGDTGGGIEEADDTANKVRQRMRLAISVHDYNLLSKDTCHSGSDPLGISNEYNSKSVPEAKVPSDTLQLTNISKVFLNNREL
jgi:hypothetical protein